eukprot:302927-Hanusia_phi.AAC.1
MGAKVAPDGWGTPNGSPEVGYQPDSMRGRDPDSAQEGYTKRLEEYKLVGVLLVPRFCPCSVHIMCGGYSNMYRGSRQGNTEREVGSTVVSCGWSKD